MLRDEYSEAVPALEDLRVGIRGASRFPGLARICEAYWEREALPGGEIRFVASVGDAGQEVGLSGSQVSKLAGMASVAILGNMTCPECGLSLQSPNISFSGSTRRWRATRGMR